MKEIIKVGYVGLGRRGLSMLDLAISKMKDVEFVALCDFDDEKLKEAEKILVNRRRKAPILTNNYQDLLDNKEIDAIFLFTSWEGRVPMAIAAMKAGKYVAVEVGCADNLDECFELVKTYEETGKPCMMLENICYNERELMALNIVKQGLFGDIVHCTGGYCHNLNKYEFFLEKVRKPELEDITHYRLPFYQKYNYENYPTHALGPIAKTIGINRGNRFTKLTSFASASGGIKEWAKNQFGEDCKYAQMDYAQGDIVNTIITCSGGQTILLTLDTTAPRNTYSRLYSIRGTKGMSDETSKVIFLDGVTKNNTVNNEQEMFEQYGHPLNKEAKAFEPEATKFEQKFGLHPNGVDWMVFRAFVESVKNGTNTPIDTYDTATWLAVGPLSKKSVEGGSVSVDFPDFTNGKWQNREPIVKSKYCLDEVVVDDSIGIFDSVLPHLLEVKTEEEK